MCRTVVLACVVVMVIAGVARAQSCSHSGQCQTSQCCRSSQNNAPLINDPQSFPWLQGAQSGQCVAGYAGPNEGCDGTCRCQPGYVCRRPLTGVCCARSRCISECEAERERLQAMCFPPPMAPPPGPGPGLADVREKRSVGSVVPSFPFSNHWKCRLLLLAPWDRICGNSPLLKG